MNEYNFIYRLGTVNVGGRSASIFVEAVVKTEKKDYIETIKKVSLHGVVGPLKNGNALGYVVSEKQKEKTKERSAKHWRDYQKKGKEWSDVQKKMRDKKRKLGLAIKA